MSKEAMKLALEHAKRDERHASHAETRYWCRMYRDIAEKAVEALAEQPAPGRAHYEDGDVFERISAMKKQPAQRTWVGLTDDEILYCVELENPKAIAEEVEAKLKEKNT